jgi:glycosyltransferase involved in cell wall biosynthesis
MTIPEFSIVTPTRNALSKLRRCVGSLRGQVGVSYEHLVQDALSADSTGHWLHEQAQGDGRLLPVCESDSGMYDAINRGWARSRGTFLSWLNSDEQYLPGTLALISRWFKANPEVDVVFGDYLVVTEDGQAVAVRREIPLRRFYVANSFLNAQSCTIFFRRSLLDRGLLTLESRFRYAADKDLMLKLLQAGVRIAHLPEVVALFGIDGSNLSTHPAMEEEAEAIRRAYGGLPWRPLRAIPLVLRRLERLGRGSYRGVTLDYAFALDEVPHYARYRASKLGGRYSLKDTQGCSTRIEETVS